MSAKVYVERERADHVRLTNNTGAILERNEFAVIGGLAVVADEDIGSGSVGSFHVAEGIEVQASDFVTGESTFGTPNARVFWNGTSKQFSDTSTAGYYDVGTLKAAKSGGVIKFLKNYRAELVAA